MTVVEHIKNAKKPYFSFEILPPLKGSNINFIYDIIDSLIEFKPPFVNITYHREEVVYKKHKTGLLERRKVHKRPGTVAISAAIKYKYQIDVVPHIICGGFSKEETENALIDLHFLGINNLLVLRGDPLKFEKTFTPECDGHNYAIDLVRQIVNLNKGIYLDDEMLNLTSTNFSIGVAGYPEKHIEAPNMQFDIKYLQQKIEAGAEYIITQLFYDNQKYYDFVKLCHEAGIDVPIIPGIKPLSTLAHLRTLPQTFNIDLPNDLVREVEKCKTNAEAREVGVEWAIHQSRDLIKQGVPGVHYFTMGKADNIRKIAESIF